ncbi:MAG: hypothetical protein KBA71_11065 [Opitutaceae bacterium]|nr:hypothetical protein [Opitutaceae bacterium]
MSLNPAIFAELPAESAMQTWLALAVVAMCAVWLTLRLFSKARRGSDCGSGGCGAVSKDARRLQAHLRKKPRGGILR